MDKPATQPALIKIELQEVQIAVLNLLVSTLIETCPYHQAVMSRLDKQIFGFETLLNTRPVPDKKIEIALELLGQFRQLPHISDT